MARITTNGTIILESGSIASHNTPDVYAHGEYNPFDETWLVKITLTKPGAGASAIYADSYIRYTKAAIDAYTGTGTGDTAKIQNALLQAVKATLLALNASITFTIA